MKFIRSGFRSSAIVKIMTDKRKKIKKEHAYEELDSGIETQPKDPDFIGRNNIKETSDKHAYSVNPSDVRINVNEVKPVVIIPEFFRSKDSISLKMKCLALCCGNEPR